MFNVGDKVILPAQYDKSGTVESDDSVVGTVVLVDPVRVYSVLVALDPAYTGTTAERQQFVDVQSNTQFDWSFTSAGREVQDGEVVCRKQPRAGG